ncbi:glycosyl hydrolase [Paenibacillus sp. LHD-117]|uniref:family 43 glycosylhydrolase n=1 Tax=Paenibacillus sp. LHD-117 TaxID=3071412 RepID=UPI0027E1DBA2|nr:family 43 glycosylhydrolase [Paenibacillus sp. LHD-117]MDQ6417904.1 glycosyl hydrolase [Paenibacillus sp. LHD-117]
MDNVTKAPLFRDPVYDGAADPVVIWSREAREWWMLYTNRRATAEGRGFAWVHGTDIGVASSVDGKEWLYRGVLEGLDTEWGRNTFWAPEVYWHEGTYHMYVSYIRGVPERWGFPARMLHYTSRDLIKWSFQSELNISDKNIIDACIFRMPDGMFRMWFKESNHTYAAESKDLYEWKRIGPVIEERWHEGPNVFEFKGYYWMIVDEWRGQGVYRSDDLVRWERNGLILDQPGSREDDGTIGLHADVVVQGDRAFIFYFTHPERTDGNDESTYGTRRSSIQAAELEVANGILICDRDKPFELFLLPEI